MQRAAGMVVSSSGIQKYQGAAMIPLRSVFIVLALTLIGALPALGQTREITTRISPHEVVSAHIGSRGGPLMIIVYGRPYSKDPKSGEIRKIWGGLVPFDKVWRTGADEATLMIIAKPIVIGDTTIPAGAYTLFTLPKADGTAKLIINKKIGQWGIPYNEDKEKDNELARIDLQKAPAPATQVDQFTISIEPDTITSGETGGAMIKMVWETTAFALPFTLAK
jgi:Protein of unknown function (DUF2911)